MAKADLRCWAAQFHMILVVRPYCTVFVHLPTTRGPKQSKPSSDCFQSGLILAQSEAAVNRSCFRIGPIWGQLELAVGRRACESSALCASLGTEISLHARCQLWLQTACSLLQCRAPPSMGPTGQNYSNHIKAGLPDGPVIAISWREFITAEHSSLL